MKDTIELNTRVARCQCGKVRESNWDLPFFEYRGDGSRAAVDFCKCGYAMTAHLLPSKPRNICHRAEKHGAWPHDIWYCGCNGLD